MEQPLINFVLFYQFVIIILGLMDLHYIHILKFSYIFFHKIKLNFTLFIVFSNIHYIM